MIDSPYFKEMQRDLDQYIKDLQEQERSLKMKDLNEDNISKKYFELMNLIGIKNQIIRRMEALEHVMEAYPSSFTLSEVKEQLMHTDIKYEKLIRNFIVDCLNNKDMKDEEETAKMIFQAFNIHPSARWENGKYVLPNKKKDTYEQEERITQTKESKNHLRGGRKSDTLL